MEILKCPPTSRSVIPPVGCDVAQPEEGIGALQNRLEVVELEAKDLVEQLGKMGFRDGGGSGTDTGSAGEACPPPLTPYSARLADPNHLRRDYERLVSRVCKVESGVQTLKLNLVRAEAERDLSKEERATAGEKLAATSDAYEKELSRLQRELVQGRRDLKAAQEERRRAQEEMRHLQEALQAATSDKSEATMLMEDLQAAKTKLSRRVTELREETAREASLRASLEESQNTLLARLQEMEENLAKDQEQMVEVSATSNQLKRDCLRAREEAELERSLRLQAEETLKNLTTNSDNLQSQVASLQEDKVYLTSEMNKMRTRYNGLIQQLDQTQKLINDKQTTFDQLEKENKRLHEAMKSTSSQNVQLVAKYEEQLEGLRTDVAGKEHTEEQVKQLSEQLRTESREKGHAIATSSQQAAYIQELEDKVRLQESDLKEAAERHRKELEQLRQTLRDKESEKERVMRDKDSLLDEVNQAVDDMVEERSRLQTQLTQAGIEQQTAAQSYKTLEQENSRLLERVAALEEQAATANQVESALTEMIEQKNRLAYEKGRLQNRVGELQSDVESLAASQTEFTQLRQVAASVEANFKKSQSELSNCRILNQRLESQLKQAQSSSERKEQDFRLALKARDEAVAEAQRLLQHIESLQGQKTHKVTGLEQSLRDSQTDKKKMAKTLESVLQSHSQLQLTVEGLQVQLGQRDARISQLESEKSELRHHDRQVQKELDNLQAKLVSMDALEATEIDPLREALKRCKDDNTKMAASLESLVRSNDELQASKDRLQDEVEKKTCMLEEMRKVRDSESGEHQMSLRTYEERLLGLKEQLTQERQKTTRKNNKEIMEVRKQLDDLLTKNGELSQANTDLRHKVTEVEYAKREVTNKLTTQQTQIEHLTRIRKKQDEALESFQEVTDQIDILEQSNKEYVRKNDHQARLIEKFMAQMSSLQEELQGVAQTQSETASLLQQQEEQLRTERQRYEQLSMKYKMARKREKELESLRKHTEEKLKEANTESLEISANLSDAHSWFKSKFEVLQNELSHTRKNQAGLVTENMEQKLLLEKEKRKAQDTAEKARQMIKASRETISRLADYAEVAQRDTTTQLRSMRKQMETEAEYARQTQAKYAGLKESSLRYTEKLARELELLRSQCNYSADSENISA